MTLRSRRTDVPGAWEAVNDYFYERRQSDGLPVVPPTEERVLAMIEAADRDPGEELGVLPPRFAPVTVEKVAVNAVLAGCLPAYLPVVLAAVEAVLDPDFNIFGVQATTGSPSTLIVVNGPISRRLEINGASNCLGPGWRANATIGRALRLILNNVGGALPKDARRAGVGDMATFGWPGKYTACLAEYEEALPAGWQPFHVERGFSAQASAVTVISTAGFIQLSDRSPDPNEVASCIAAGMSVGDGRGGVRFYGQPLVLVGSEHAATLARGGFDRARLRQELYRRTTPEGSQGVASSPDDILLVVAGGEGNHSAFLPPWNNNTRCVTRPVRPGA